MNATETKTILPDTQYKVLAFDIDWDADEEEPDFDTITFEITFDDEYQKGDEEVEDQLVDMISDLTGFCVEGYNYELEPADNTTELTTPKGECVEF